MANKEKETREPMDLDLEQAERLSEAELDSIIGGGADAINTSRSNTKDN